MTVGTGGAEGPESRSQESVPKHWPAVSRGRPEGKWEPRPAGSGVISCPEPREKDEGWLSRDRAANRVGCVYFLFLTHLIYLFLAVLGLRCCLGFSLVSRGTV